VGLDYFVFVDSMAAKGVGATQSPNIYNIIFLALYLRILLGNI